MGMAAISVFVCVCLLGALICVVTGQESITNANKAQKRSQLSGFVR